MILEHCIFAVLGLAIGALGALCCYLIYIIIFSQYKYVMTQLSHFYLCGHDLYSMIEADFFKRFGSFNKEGFCYTVSAAIMIALKDARFVRTRLVRGYTTWPDDRKTLKPHSWVEVEFPLRIAYVVDPCWTDISFTKRRAYYRRYRPQIKVIYTEQEFWQDELALLFYERLSRPETSKVFVNLCYCYSPMDDSLRIPEDKRGGDVMPPPGRYWPVPKNVFGEEKQIWFDQRIVNEFMARPERTLPKGHTLRCLKSRYRHCRKRASLSSDASY